MLSHQPSLICLHSRTQRKERDHRGRDLMVVGFKLPMQSVPITTDVVSSNRAQGEVYNIMG